MNEYVYLGIAAEVSDFATDTRDNQQGGCQVRIEQKNKFCVGDRIEIMKPDGRNVPVEVLSMVTAEGEKVESAPHAGQVLWVGLSGAADKYDILRVSKKQLQIVQSIQM